MSGFSGLGDTVNPLAGVPLSGSTNTIIPAIWTTNANVPSPVKANRSESIGKLVLALAKAQSEFEEILKETRNPAYNSKYADLANLIAGTQPALAKNELVVFQLPVRHDQDAGVLTILAHSSDQWISTELLLPAKIRERFDAQGIGGAITYARRYTYSAILNVAAEKDEDANSISDTPTPKRSHSEQPQQQREAPNPYSGPMAAPAAAIPEPETEPTELTAKSLGKRSLSMVKTLVAEGLTNSEGLSANDKVKKFLTFLSQAGSFESMSLETWNESLNQLEKLTAAGAKQTIATIEEKIKEAK